jgi:hypothetical protein
VYISPITFFATASGFMIDNVCSIVILNSPENLLNKPIKRALK